MPKKRKKTQRKTTRRKSTKRRQQPAPTQGWSWGLLGLGIGLSVSAFIYLNNRPAEIDAPTVDATEQPESKPGDSRKESAAQKSAPQKSAADAKEERRFTFYDVLEDFEVMIFEEEAPVATRSRSAPIDTPGIYVLQAGSFGQYADADRRKAQLAMLGVESGIQKVTVDDKVYHRVRVGPLEDLDELERLRQQLSGAEIDAVVLRVGE